MKRVESALSTKPEPGLAGGITDMIAFDADGTLIDDEGADWM